MSRDQRTITPESPISDAWRLLDRHHLQASPVLDVNATSWRFTVGGVLPITLGGAAVRLTRIARFALYRGGTGEHWLGFTEVQPATGAWVTIQPVSGPYLPFRAAAPGTSGVALSGRDSSGGPTTTPSS